jgi:hypothetical protein
MFKLSNIRRMPYRNGFRYTRPLQTESGLIWDIAIQTLRLLRNHLPSSA